MKKLIKIIALFLTLTPLSALAKEDVTLIIHNATVVTMDEALTVHKEGTVVVRDDTIVSVGGEELLELYTAPETIDAGGSIVMPGMINTHNHISMVAFRGLGEYAVEDRLFKFFFPLEKELLNRNLIRVSARHAAMELVLGGVTTVTDMYYHEDEVAKSVKQVGMRGVLGQTIIGFPVVDSEEPYGGLEYAVDFIEAFKGDDLITPALAPHAPYTVSAEKLMETKALAAEYDVPIVIHLAEFHGEKAKIEERFPDTPKDQSVIEYLDGIGFLGPEVLGAHVIAVNDSDMELLKKRGVGIAHNPKANTKGGDGLAPAWEMVQKNLAVGLGTDGPMSSNQMDTLSVMGYAARIARIRYEDGIKFTPVELVQMATIGGARALNMEDRIGSLEPGKAADIIILDTNSPNMQPLYDVYAAIAFQANPGDVSTTIVNGRTVVKDRIIQTIDLETHQKEWNSVTQRVAEFAKTLR